MSAAVLIPIAILAIYLGGLAVALVVAATIAGAYREYETMLNRGRHDWRGRATTGLLALMPIGYAAGGFWASLLLLAVAVLFALAAADRGGRHLMRAPGGAVLGFTGLAILALRGETQLGIWQDGISVALFLAFVVVLTDSGAFFTGRLLGGARLSPEISPSKTWTGAFGGLLFGTIGGLVIWIFATQSPIWIGLAIAGVVSVLAQLGDLAESAVKRRFMVKNSGDIIPGHGGILDRIDSFTLAGIGLFIIGAAHNGLDAVAHGVLAW